MGRTSSAEQKNEVAKVAQFLREHYREPFRAAEAAKLTHYSERGLRAAFRRITGKTLLEYHHGLRVERARELLRETGLPVVQVALEAGYRNLAHFHRVFRRHAGCTPAAFRAREQEGEPAERAPGGRRAGRAEDWKPDQGTWRVRGGVLVGSGRETVQITYAHLLPEAFAIEVRFRVRGGTARHGGAGVRLRGSGSASSYDVGIGVSGNQAGSLTDRDGHVIWNEKALLRPGEEQTLRLELDDAGLRVDLDGNRVFTHREVFPVPYAERSRMSLWHWAGIIEMLGFELVDLGLPAQVRTVRMGDELYANGSYAAARRVYTELRDSASSPDEEAELSVKLGWTHAAEHDLRRARRWFSTVASSKSSGFWHERARLAQLSLHARRDDHDALLAEARALRAGFPDLAPQIDRTLHEEALELWRRGFFARCGRLLASVVRSGAGSVWALFSPARVSANCAMMLRRFEEAERILLRWIGAFGRDFPRRAALFHDLCSLRIQAGRFGGAERARRTASRLPGDLVTRTQLLYDRVTILRGEGRPEEALFLLDEIERSGGDSPTPIVHVAIAYRQQILCGTGRIAEAREALERAARGPAWRIDRAENLYVPPALEGDLEEARKILETAHRSERLVAWHAGLLCLIAAVLTELQGKKRDTRRAWQDVGRRFPASRVHYIALAAAELAAGTGTSTLRKLPYDIVWRSEIFYWAAKLHEHRGDARTARSLLRLCVKADPTRRWPAELARRELGSVTL